MALAPKSHTGTGGRTVAQRTTRPRGRRGRGRGRGRGGDVATGGGGRRKRGLIGERRRRASRSARRVGLLSTTRRRRRISTRRRGVLSTGGRGEEGDAESRVDAEETLLGLSQARPKRRVRTEGVVEESYLVASSTTLLHSYSLFAYQHTLTHCYRGLPRYPLTKTAFKQRHRHHLIPTRTSTRTRTRTRTSTSTSTSTRSRLYCAPCRRRRRRRRRNNP